MFSLQLLCIFADFSKNLWSKEPGNFISTKKAAEVVTAINPPTQACTQKKLYLSHILILMLTSSKISDCKQIYLQYILTFREPCQPFLPNFTISNKYRNKQMQNTKTTTAT